MPALLFSPQQSTTNQIYLSDIFLTKQISEKNDIVILKADISSISCMYFIYHFPQKKKFNEKELYNSPPSEFLPSLYSLIAAIIASGKVTSGRSSPAGSSSAD